MNALKISLIILLLGCSNNISPDNVSEDVLFIFQFVNSEGQIISGSDSLVSQTMIENFPTFFFEQSDTSIYIKKNLIPDLDKIKVVIITANRIFSSTIIGTTSIIHLLDKNNGIQLDSLLLDNDIEYRIDYDYEAGNIIIYPPTGISSDLNSKAVFEDTFTSIDSNPKWSAITQSLIEISYEYTHYQKVINYGFIKRSKIKTY